MTRSRFRQFAVFFTLSFVIAGNPAGAEDVAAALQIHLDSTTFGEEVAALDSLRRTADTHPEGWQAAFWACYLSTHVARLVMLERGEGDIPALTDSAQDYHDRAVSRLGTEIGPEASSLLALQSLIYRLRGSQEDAEHQALNEAARADPENPVVWVFLAAGLITEGTQNHDLSRVVAGRVLLERAERRFKADPRPLSQTTAFNWEWLPIWISKAEKALQEGV